MGDRPETLSVLLATEWLSNLTTSWAWDELNGIVGAEPDAAWKLIRAMVACAPEYGILAAIAAGPVESFFDQHGEKYEAAFRTEAEANPRFRACLRATHTEWPPEVAKLLHGNEGRGRALPHPNTLPDGTSAENMSLIISWFHHNTTSWASLFLSELIVKDATKAWDAIRVLLVLAEEDQTGPGDILEGSLRPFLRKNFASHRDAILAEAKRKPRLRSWLLKSKRPMIEDGELWASFVAHLSTA